MKNDKNSIKKWVYWFTFAVAVIIVFNILSNITNVTNWIGELIKVLMPFGMGLLIAYILYLPCRKIETIYKKTKKKRFIHKHARGLSIVTTYLIALIIIVILLNVIMPTVIQSLTDLLNNLPGYYNTAIERINSLPEDNILKSKQVVELINSVQEIDLTSLININKMQEYIQGVISAVSTIFNIFIAVVVSVYILAQRRQLVDFWAKVVRAFTKNETYVKIRGYFNKANEIFFSFLTSQILDALLVGVLVSIAMSIIGVKYSVLIGFMIGLFNLIPYFGAIVAVIIAIIITLFTGGLGQTILMAVIVIILQQIDANIINPKIVGSSLKISQIVVLLAVTIGGAYFGVLGMFLAVPIFTVFKVILEDFVNEKNEKKQKTEKI